MKSFRAGSISVRGCFVADLPAIAERVGAQRMGERRGSVSGREDDVVRGKVAGCEARRLADAFGDLVVRARGVTADAEAADPRLSFVESQAAAEGDGAAAHLAQAGRRVAGGARAQRIQRIPVGGAVEGVSRL